MKKMVLWKSIPLVLAVSLMFYPVHGFLWWKDTSSLSPVNKQVIQSESVSFSPYDFFGMEDFKGISILSLPDAQYGTMYVGNSPIHLHDTVELSALSALKFQSKSVLGTTSFVVSPIHLDGSLGDSVEVSIEVLDTPNQAPLAKDMELFTYENIEISCYFDVIDSEGDYLSFQIVNPAARGSVTLAEDGSSSFVYSPYENKSGKDSFQYIATDSNGNVSNEGTVSIRIEKAKTVAFYGDMDGNSAHKAAISLAEAGIYVGECIGNTYLFQPEQMVSREEFLSLAMAVAKLTPLEDVTMTGFYDDSAIPTWSKGYVSSALLAGVIQGSQDEGGKPVFSGESTITYGEASVILDNLLKNEPVSDVSAEHWASQACANLNAVGVSGASTLSFPSGLNRGEVAELLDGALALFKEKDVNWMDW